MGDPNSFDSPIQIWRDAERRALDLEDAIFKKGLLHARGEGPAPTREEKQFAQEARQRAQLLFQDAMHGLGVESKLPQPSRASGGAGTFPPQAKRGSEYSD